MDKHSNNVRLARIHKMQAESEVNKALVGKDIIDDTEFLKITRCRKDYYKEKNRLRQPSYPTAAPP